MVMSRRSHTFILWWMKPSMITWPAIVAVVDDESPEANRARAKATPAYDVHTEQKQILVAGSGTCEKTIRSISAVLLCASIRRFTFCPA